jgi:hypothetical protein
MKLVINATYGGYRLSETAQRFLGPEARQMPRDDPRLVQYVEKFGADYDSCLRVMEIPDDVNWYIDDYDGYETVREGRTWTWEGN